MEPNAMTLACHHAPRETATSCQPRCVHCGIMIGQAPCGRCLGDGRVNLIEQLVDCVACGGRGFHWVEVRTFVVTSPNREGHE